MAAPAEIVTTYCTDEDVCVLCYADFATLAPKDQVLAQGSDGVFAAGNPWQLTSASTNFASQGVAVGNVLQLLGPRGAFPGSGVKMAVSAVAGSTATLRRIGRVDGVGQPPAPASGLTGVSFLVATFNPQIEYACYDLNQRMGIDPGFAIIAPTTIYDLRALQQCAVLSVVVKAYRNDSRSKEGDFSRKLTEFTRELSDVLARTQIRWNQIGKTPPPTSARFSTRIGR